jgi:predicted Zn-dependent protease
VCAAAWPKCPAALVANSCLVVLEAAEGNKVVQGRVERQLQAALKADPQSVVLRLSLANLRVVEQRYGDAETIYRDLIRGDRSNVMARNNLAWLLACQKKSTEEALTLMDEAIAAAGPLPTLLDTQAQVFLQANRTKESIKLLEGLVAEAPQKASYRLHLAQAYLADRNRSEARRSLLKAHGLGLKASTLHPLARRQYEEFVRDLGPQGRINK